MGRRRGACPLCWQPALLAVPNICAVPCAAKGLAPADRGLVSEFVRSSCRALSGGTRREDLARYAYRPDVVVESLADLCGLDPESIGEPSAAVGP